MILTSHALDNGIKTTIFQATRLPLGNCQTVLESTSKTKVVFEHFYSPILVITNLSCSGSRHM